MKKMQHTTFFIVPVLSNLLSTANIKGFFLYKISLWKCDVSDYQYFYQYLSSPCVAQYLVFCVVFCRALFVLLSLYFLSFFNLRLLTASSVSSDLSYCTVKWFRSVKMLCFSCSINIIIRTGLWPFGAPRLNEIMGPPSDGANL